MSPHVHPLGFVLTGLLVLTLSAAVSAVVGGRGDRARRRVLAPDVAPPSVADPGATARPEGLLASLADLALGRGRRLDSAQLTAALDSVVASLASGATLNRAIEQGADLRSPVGRDLALVARRSAGGSPLIDELDGWAAASGDPGAVLAVDALAISGVTGGSHRRALERVAATLRERQALSREVDALAAQTAASAVLLVATPAVFALFMAVMHDGTGRFLLTTPAGWACILGGTILDLAGALWMRRLLRRAR